MKKRYTEVASQLMREIRAGGYTVGDPVPSEAELCARFNVSRSTIRNALSQLQTLGVVERKQGAATRVKAVEVAPTYVHSMSATGDLMQFAGPSWRRVRSVAQIVADEALARRLDHRPGRRWTLIRQTRHIAEAAAPVGWTDIYLDATYAAIAEDLPDYPGLVYALLEDRYGVLIHEIRQSISAGPVPEEFADVLGVPAGDHALELTRHYLDAEGESQIVTISVLPAKNYSYEIRLKRQG